MIERLSDEEFHAYRMEAGSLTADRFASLLASPEWQEMSEADQQKAFTEIKQVARKDARESLGLGGKAAGGNSSSDEWDQFSDAMGDKP